MCRAWFLDLSRFPWRPSSLTPVLFLPPPPASTALLVSEAVPIPRMLILGTQRQSCETDRLDFTTLRSSPNAAGPVEWWVQSHIDSGLAKAICSARL